MLHWQCITLQGLWVEKTDSWIVGSGGELSPGPLAQVRAIGLLCKPDCLSVVLGM